MKRFRLLFALVVVVAMLSTVAFAADPVNFKNSTMTCADGETITVELVTSEALTVGYATGQLDYTASKWTISEVSSKIALIEDNGRISFGKTDFSDVAIAAGEAVLSFKATAIGDVAGETFELKNLCIMDSTGMNMPYDGTGAAKVLTIEAAAQDTPATISAPNMAWAEYTVGNTKYVGVWTGAYTVTAGTKDVTDIEVAVNGAAAEALGVEAEAGGEVSFKIAVIGKPELTADGVVVTAVE